MVFVYLQKGKQLSPKCVFLIARCILQNYAWDNLSSNLWKIVFSGSKKLTYTFFSKNYFNYWLYFLFFGNHITVYWGNSLPEKQGSLLTNFITLLHTHLQNAPVQRMVKPRLTFDSKVRREINQPSFTLFLLFYLGKLTIFDF